MFATWTLVLLGIAPVLIGAAQLRHRMPIAWLPMAGVAGGVICAIVGVGSLLRSDQSAFDIPFLIGSLLVTLWLIGTGIVMWRSSEGDTVAPTAAPGRPLETTVA